MNTNRTIKSNPAALFIIGLLSLTVPGLVAVLYLKPELNLFGIDVSVIPHINAVLNSATAVLLTCGYYFIRNGNRKLHIRSMISAFILSSFFLILYVIYHSTAGHTYFGDADFNGVLSEAEKQAVGWVRGIYGLILLTHIAIAIIIVPFVLSSVYFGWQEDFQRHRKISKWTFPLWLYVAVSGVIVYLMISPYYH
jgi:putative membrane protein